MKKSERKDEINSSCLPCYNYGSGAGWRSKRDKKKHPSQTPGKIKAPTCQASTMKRYFAKTSRSYKHPDYDKWLKDTRTMK